MQAIVLLRAPGDPIPAEKVLSEMRFDLSFVNDTGAILESVNVAFGTSHFAIVMNAATTDCVYRGIRELRRRLNDLVDDPEGDERTATSTLLGWDPESDLSFASIFKRACADGAAKGDAIANATANELNEIMGRFVLDCYINERVTYLSKLLSMVARHDDRLVTLSKALDAYLAL